MCKKCASCDKTISMDATSCPYCGAGCSGHRRYPDRFPATHIAPDGRKFVWGGVVSTLRLGDYHFIQYIPNRVGNESYAEWEAKFLTNPTQYHIYVEVDGKIQDACTSARNLEGAILLAIAYKNKDVNAATYAAKVLGVKL